jgi:PAS domain S-box-containing protein
MRENNVSNLTNHMSKAHQSLKLSKDYLSPVMIVMLVVFVQILFLGAYFHMQEEDLLTIESAELTLLLAYSMLVIGLAIAIAVIRTRWIKREETVRQRLLGVIDAIPDPSAVRDFKGRYVMWNRAAEDYHGIRAEHVLGKTPFDLFPPAVARQILELDAKCSLKGHGVVQRLELPPLYGKGKRVATIRIAPVFSPSDNSVRGVVTILHDVTEEEKEALTLRNTATQLKMALDTSGFGSWRWDVDTDEQIYSAQYQHLLRYTGKNFHEDYVFLDRLHPGDRQIVTEAAQASVRNKTAYDQVYRLRCFDEKYRYFHVSGELVLDKHGKRQFAGLLCPLDRNAD